MILVSLFQEVVKSNHEEQLVQDFITACFDKYYDSVFYYALGKTKCQATTEDIAQDTFLNFKKL